MFLLINNFHPRPYLHNHHHQPFVEKKRATVEKEEKKDITKKINEKKLKQIIQDYDDYYIEKLDNYKFDSQIMCSEFEKYI